MKKYLNPEMEIELFDGQDLMTADSYGDIDGGCTGDCDNDMFSIGIPDVKI